jgi:hypothetical protein
MMRTEGFRNSCEWVIWADANSHIAGKDLNLYLIVCRNQSDHPHDPRRAVLKCPNGTTFTYLVAGISPGAGRGPGILFLQVSDLSSDGFFIHVGDGGSKQTGLVEIAFLTTEPTEEFCARRAAWMVLSGPAVACSR